jgi:plasmid maintenance system killer protein
LHKREFMRIIFQSKKLSKLCEDEKALKRRYGKMSSKILLSLDDLRGANTLSDFRTIPQYRCHELTGDRKGQLAIVLMHPFRFIFEPADDPPAKKPDGGIDWNNVKIIQIIEIEDYH